MSVKEQVLQAIHRLPEDAGYRDIAEEIALLAAVREAEDDIHAGRLVTKRANARADRRMDRQLIWTERASSDIEAIVRYIARRNPAAASQIGLGIYDRAQILLRHSEAGAVLAELRDGGWRKLIYRRWKLIYTIRGQAIIVSRVWPAALGEANLQTPF